MKKIININLSGRVIPIEDSAYEKLQAYIESLRRYFAKEEGRDEIINDIEARIAELMSEKIRLGSSAITDSDVNEIVSSMGTIESVLEVVELRMVLEGEIAALAAERRTKAQMAAIRRALKHIEEDVETGSDGVDADIAFHRSIAEATNNPHFLALIEFLFNFLRSATRTTREYEATNASLVEQVKSEHLAIVQAIADQAPEIARASARKHMQGASERLDKKARQEKLALRKSDKSAKLAGRRKTAPQRGLKTAS